MARKPQSSSLYVHMNGIRVGVLQKNSDGSLSFTYDEKWLIHHNRRPISLSMPLTEFPYKGHVIESFFDNLLPDNEQIRSRIQTRFQILSKKPFDLLTQIGADCVGALQLLSQEKITNIRKVDADPIDKHGIALLLKHYQSAPLGMNKNSDFRISIAGAQEKTALLWYRDKWHLPKGATPTSHIFKLPIGEIKHAGIDLRDSVENEWLCLKILSAYGLPVCKASMEKFEDVKVLVVERFDRRWSPDARWLMRLPQEDFCQILGVPPALKYESDGGPGILQIMQVLKSSQYSNRDRECFIKAVLLFWILGATDGHAKNFSVMLHADNNYQLAPLYDVISAYPLIAKRQLQKEKLKMAMALKSQKKHYLWHSIARRHWLATASLCQFPEKKMNLLIDEVCDTMESVITKVTTDLPKKFPDNIVEPIFFYMRQTRDRLA